MVNYNVIFVFFISHDFVYDYAVITYALAVNQNLKPGNHGDVCRQFDPLILSKTKERLN